MELVKNSRLLDSVPDSSILASYFCEIFKILLSSQILNIPGGLLPLNSWTKISYAFVISPLRSNCTYFWSHRPPVTSVA